MICPFHKHQGYKQNIRVFFPQISFSPSPFFFFPLLLLLCFLLCYSSTTTIPLLFSATQLHLLFSASTPSSTSSTKIISHRKKLACEPKLEFKSPTTIYTKITSQRNNTKQNSMSTSKSQKKQKKKGISEPLPLAILATSCHHLCLSSFCSTTAIKSHCWKPPHYHSPPLPPSHCHLDLHLEPLQSTHLCRGVPQPKVQHQKKKHMECCGGGGVGLKGVREVVQLRAKEA